MPAALTFAVFQGNLLSNKDARLVSDKLLELRALTRNSSGVCGEFGPSDRSSRVAEAFPWNCSAQKQIPNFFVQSYKSRSAVPKEVTQAWADLNPGWDVRFFDDTEAIAFLSQHYSAQYVAFWSDTRLEGRFKADFFRCCYLYKIGGVWADIDIPPEMPLDVVIHPSASFMSVAGGEDQIVQAILGAVPGHPILKEAMEKMIDVGVNIRAKYSGFEMGPEWPTFALRVIVAAAMGIPPIKVTEGVFPSRYGVIQLASEERSVAAPYMEGVLLDAVKLPCRFCFRNVSIGECRYGENVWLPGRGFPGFSAQHDRRRHDRRVAVIVVGAAFAVGAATWIGVDHRGMSNKKCQTKCLQFETSCCAYTTHATTQCTQT